MPLPMTCAWRVMGAKILASLTFGGETERSGAISVAVLDGGSWSSWMRGRGPRGSLKASVRRWWSMRREKRVSRIWVRICEKGGDSIRSAVSSRRRRREGEVEEDVEEVGWVAGGEEEEEEERGIVVAVVGEDVGFGTPGGGA